MSARIFLIFLALYSLLGMHFFMHNQGGSGLYLPFNMVGWAFISVLIGIGIWHLTALKQLTFSRTQLWFLAGFAILLLPFLNPQAEWNAQAEPRFLAIAAGQPVEWNSFLTVTAVLLIFTCFFGRHFCGYACAFGSFGDAVYEGFSWIRMKCFHKKKKPALSEKMVHGLQKVKYIVLALILLSCLTGVYGKLTGTSPWDVFSMLTAGRLPNSKYLVGIVLLVLIIVGMCTQERFFCQFLCPMGAVFALMPILPGALFRRTSEKCPPKCGLCKKRCPAHLDIDGDTGRSGECLCCHACAAACPRKNIHIGTIEEK